MERLTIRRDYGITMKPGYNFRIDPDDFDLVQEILAKLAAYEDTGLEPEEIAKAQKGMQAALALACEAQAYRNAEKEGRLVVLPCKVGDTVYRLITPKDAPAVICEKPIRTVGEAANLVGWLGKKRPLISVFASREEAERALEEGAE